ncbi:hypothetical protein U1Q18_031460, partial [Sarracenia purpurea var. burkii]
IEEFAIEEAVAIEIRFAAVIVTGSENEIRLAAASRGAGEQRRRREIGGGKHRRRRAQAVAIPRKGRRKGRGGQPVGA